MNKTNKFLNIILVLVLMISLVACKGTNEEEQCVVVKDFQGSEVEVIKNPTKVACVSRTTYDLLISFGLGDCIDGALKSIYNNQWLNYIYPKSKDEYRYEYRESYETFLSRGVDLVFSPEPSITSALREHSVCAVEVSLYGNPTYDEYVYRFADIVKEIWDSEEVHQKVDKWKNSVAKSISDITEELKKHETTKQKVFYVRGDSNRGIGYTDSKSSFTEYAYRILGFEFGGATLNATQPTIEAIVEFKPDVFVIGGVYQKALVKTLNEDTVLSTLDAVKNNKIYTIPVGITMFEQISVMTPIFLYDQANKLYPEYFNYDIKTLVKETIKESFNKELTDQEIDYMLNGKNMNGEDLA